MLLQINLIAQSFFDFTFVKDHRFKCKLLIALIKSWKVKWWRRWKINFIQFSFLSFLFVYLLVNQFILVSFDIYFPFIFRGAQLGKFEVDGN